MENQGSDDEEFIGPQPVVSGEDAGGEAPKAKKRKGIKTDFQILTTF